MRGVLVVGASSPIGQAICAAFADDAVVAVSLPHHSTGTAQRDQPADSPTPPAQHDDATPSRPTAQPTGTARAGLWCWSSTARRLLARNMRSRR